MTNFKMAFAVDGRRIVNIFDDDGELAGTIYLGLTGENNIKIVSGYIASVKHDRAPPDAVVISFERRPMTDEEMDRVLAEAVKGWSFHSMTQAIYWLSNRIPGLTLDRIETRLRAMGEKTTFLISMPVALAPRGEAFEIKLLDGRPAKHWAWICLEGPDEAAAVRSRIGVSVEDNLARLVETGFALTKS